MNISIRGHAYEREAHGEAGDLSQSEPDSEETWEPRLEFPLISLQATRRQQPGHPEQGRICRKWLVEHVLGGCGQWKERGVSASAASVFASAAPGDQKRRNILWIAYTVSTLFEANRTGTYQNTGGFRSGVDPRLCMRPFLCRCWSPSLLLLARWV
jgi:hypothetical protein